MSDSAAKLQALKNLEEDLRMFKSWFDEEASAEDKDRQNRRAVSSSLMRIVDFMHDDMGWKDLSYGLLALCEALDNIDKGHTPNWLQNSTDGRPPIHRNILQNRAACAALMQFLMENGNSREQAARIVFRKIPKDAMQKWSGSGRKTSWKTIAGWRDRIKKPRTLESVTEDWFYDNTLSGISKWTGPTESLVKRVIDILVQRSNSAFS